VNEARLAFTLLVAIALSIILAVNGESHERSHTNETRTKPVTLGKEINQPDYPKATVLRGQGSDYQMVSDVLDGFGVESASSSYKIPVNSGGQSSAIGISYGENFLVKAGFVHASQVMHGDANSDGAIGPGDIVYLLNYFYRGGDEPCPTEAGDVNCDGVVGPGDIVFLINYLYRDGPPPLC
jgi:hypothetical protein